MELKIKFADEVVINGKPDGKKLFALNIIDTDDSEDSTIQFYRADSESELEDLIKAEYAEGCNDIEQFDEEFDNDWGIKLLPKEIGDIVE